MADTHPFIGTLAQALYTYKVQIRLSTLGKILCDKGVLAYREGLDIGSIVAAAYHYWASRDPQTACAIQYAFRGEEGEPLLPAFEDTGQTRGAYRKNSG